LSVRPAVLAKLIGCHRRHVAWVVARIPQLRGAISQGRTREEARENVIDALRELLSVRFGPPPELPDPADSDSLELTLAA